MAFVLIDRRVVEGIRHVHGVWGFYTYPAAVCSQVHGWLSKVLFIFAVNEILDAYYGGNLFTVIILSTRRSWRVNVIIAFRS